MGRLRTRRPPLVGGSRPPAKGRGARCTAGWRFTHIHHGAGKLLDHVLISQALLPHFAGAEIHNEALHDESLPLYFERKFPESDHAAFVAGFAGLPS